MPKVSVVIPNYNHARFLPRRIDSVLQQTFQNFELILLDDCSVDDSRSILSSYANDPRARTEFNEANSGSSFKQWNKGVRLARGEYVWIAESDDYADARLLQRLVAVLDGNPKTAFAYCASWRVSVDGQLDGLALPTSSLPARWAEDFVADGLEECRKSFFKYNPVVNSSAVVFRRSLYERVGYADEDLRFCGDWKLWASMALHGDIAYIAEPLNYFRFHDASMRARAEDQHLSMIESLQVIGWLLQRITPDESLLESFCDYLAPIWVPVVMSPRLSSVSRKAILRGIWQFDPHPVARAMRPALTTIRLKFLRYLRDLRPTAANESR